ncbi:MAG: hypothetical protein GQ531_11695 [Sulfurovum sp.]|nr:hypothetical protein [Sulfurovum sp.]
MTLKYQLLTLSSTLIFIGCSGGGTDSVDTTSNETAASSGATSGSVTITTPNPFPAEVLPADTISAYLDVINTARATGRECGVQGYYPATSAVTWNDELYAAAMEHSTDMAESNTFGHSGSGTSSDWTGIEYGKESTSQERTENNGYQNWKAIGENLTAGTVVDTAQEAVDNWIESDVHCVQLMNPAYTEVGMALVYEEASQYTNYWSQNFGAKRQ